MATTYFTAVVPPKEVEKLIAAATAKQPSPLFSLADFIELPLLASKLKATARPFDKWLVGQLSPATKTALANYQGRGSDPAPLQAGLLQDLNELVRGSSIYEAKRFKDITLRPETKTLLSQNPHGVYLERLNRLLVEDAYPLELARIPMAGVIEDKFVYDQPDYHIEGTIRIDLRDAKPTYRLGALKYGPVDTLITIRDFTVRIDWHRLFHIPKELCIEIKDPCGNTLIHECVRFDLGVSELVLMRDIPIRFRNDLELLDVAFRDKGGDHYELTGDVPIIGTLLDLIGPALVRGAVAQVGDFVERMLRSVFGDNPFADLLIGMLKALVAIVDLAIGFVGDIAKLAVRPLDELLHLLFPKVLEVVLQEEGFPKDLAILKEEKDRPAVTIPITTPPRVTLVQSGLQLEVYS